jgi:hypothetical protein
MIVIKEPVPNSEKCLSAQLGINFASLTLPINLSDLTCSLDVSGNTHSDALEPHMAFEDEMGNFSRIKALGPNTAVAVSRLTSCGGVIVTDENFAVACAAHCGGELSVREDWCKYILKSFTPFGGPYCLIVTVGPSGTVEKGKSVIKEYMAKLKVPDKDFRVVLFQKYGSVGVANGMVFAQAGASFEFDDGSRKSRKRKQSIIL